MSLARDGVEVRNCPGGHHRALVGPDAFGVVQVRYVLIDRDGFSRDVDPDDVPMCCRKLLDRRIVGWTARRPHRPVFGAGRA